MNENIAFHHVGIVTKKLSEAIGIYQSMGYLLCGNKVYRDPIQHAEIALMSDQGPLMELISPIDELSPAYNLLKKNGSMAYHTCYEVEDLSKYVEQSRKSGFIQVTEPSPAVAFDGRIITFVYNDAIGLVELLSKT